MITKIYKRLLPVVALLLVLALLQACSDDPADPIDPNAKNVHVRLVDRNCYGPTLQILDPHYAAYGREEYVARVDDVIPVVVAAKSVVNWQDMALNSVHYVDLEKVAGSVPNICATLNVPSHAYVNILKVY